MKFAENINWDKLTILPIRIFGMNCLNIFFSNTFLRYLALSCSVIIIFHIFQRHIKVKKNKKTKNVKL